MGSTSSAKKVARLAQRGKGKKIRATTGSSFPAILAAVVVVGLVLVIYARASVPGLDATASAVTQRNIAYGVYVCDEWVTLPAPDSQAFVDFGVSERDAGVIVMSSLPEDGNRGPRLGRFLDAYGVSLNDTELSLPADPERTVGDAFAEGDDECADGDGLLSVVTWNPASDPGSSQTYITAFSDIRLPDDAMAFAIAFTPRGADIPQPPSVTTLTALLTGPQAPVTPEPVTPEVDPNATTSVPGSDATPDGEESGSGG